MDTIGINVEFRGNVNLGVEEISRTINGIVSPYGFTYCDFRELKKNNEFGVKISYPRFFTGINARLVESNIEVIEVNRHLADKIAWIASMYGVTEVYIDLIRVDIPFTFLKPDDMEFSDYENVFRVLAMIYERTKNPNYRTKGISDMIDMSIETVNFYDKANIAISIYNQWLNIKRKTNSLDSFNYYNQTYPELKNRIRIEVRQRKRRKPFTLYDFANFDILGEYSNKYRKFLLKYLFNDNELGLLKDSLINNLDTSFKEYFQRCGGMNYATWLNKNRDKIFDYSIVREVLRRNISNPKTLESAITVVRRELNLMDKTYISCFGMLEEIRKCIKNYKFNLTNISDIEEIVQEDLIIQKQ